MPDVRRLTAADAQIRVEAQPLTPQWIYKPAAPRQRIGVVVDQRPKTGYLSAYDRLLLVVSKATQGVIPNLVGKSLDDARPRLKKLKLEPRIRWSPATPGKPGTVLEQRPKAGLAAAPGMRIELVVASAARAIAEPG